MAEQKIQRYRVVMRAETPMHIGAAPNPLTEVAGAVVRVGDRLAIPGPSFKGAYRAALERMLIESVAPNLAEARPCIPAAYSNLSPDERNLIGPAKYSGENCGYPGGGRDGFRPLCPACYLLGTMGLVGFVRVPYLMGDGYPGDGFSVRWDRALGNAARSANREFQYVEPGTEFTGTLVVLLQDDVRGWELGKPRPLKSDKRKDQWLQKKPLSQEDVLSRFVEQPIKGIQVIGGYQSKGFGEVSVSLERIEA